MRKKKKILIICVLIWVDFGAEILIFDKASLEILVSIKLGSDMSTTLQNMKRN